MEPSVQCDSRRMALRILPRMRSATSTGTVSCTCRPKCLRNKFRNTARCTSLDKGRYTCVNRSLWNTPPAAARDSCAASGCSCCSSSASSSPPRQPRACKTGSRRRGQRLRPRDRTDALRRDPHRQPAGERDGVEHQDPGDQGEGGGPVEGRPDHGARGVRPLSPRSREGGDGLPAGRPDVRGGPAGSDLPLGDSRHHRGQHRRLALLGRPRGHRAIRSSRTCGGKWRRGGSSWRTSCCATCSCPNR